MKKITWVSLVLLFASIYFISSCSKDTDDNDSPDNCCQSISMDISQWDYYSETEMTFKSPAPGVFETTSEGLKFYGTSYRYGGRISTKAPYWLKDRTVLVKWKVNGGTTFNSFAVSLYYNKNVPSSNGIEKRDLNFLSTNSTVTGSALILNDTWYYTRIVFSETEGVSTTSTGNYSHQGGNVIQSATYQLKLPAGFLAIYAGDTYGGTSTHMTVAEYKVICD